MAQWPRGGSDDDRAAAAAGDGEPGRVLVLEQARAAGGALVELEWVAVWVGDDAGWPGAGSVRGGGGRPQGASGRNQ